MTVFGPDAKSANPKQCIPNYAGTEMARPTPKRIVLLFAALFAVLVCSACAAEEDSQFEGKAVVFVAAPLSGARADAGQSALGGVRLAAEAINREGGLLGRRLAVRALDDRSDAEAVTGMAAMVQDAFGRGERVAGVIGHVDSGVAGAALPYYEELGVSLVTPGAGLPDLAYRGHAMFFRVNADDGKQAEQGAQFLVEEVEARRVAVVHTGSAYGRGLAAALVESLETLGATTALQVEIGEGQSDFTDLALSIEDAGADAVYFAGNASEASKLFGGLKSVGPNLPFLASDEAFLGSAVDGALGGAEGMYVSALAPSPDRWVDSGWVEAYRALEKRDPGPFSINGFAAMQALAAGVRAAGSFEGDAVAQAMRGIEIETLMGRMRFSANGERVDAQVWIYQVEDGEFRQVE